MENSNTRIHTIDFIKGILVMFMVVYHVLNYLQYGSIPHHYMAFLPCSFIMITGFLVMQIYSNRYNFSFKSIGLRLGIRALKLLLLFTGLNVAARMIWSKNHYETTLNIYAFFKKWFNVYVVGDTDKVAFEVLIPISYTLFLAIFILKIQSVKPYFISLFAAATFGLCTLMDVYGYSIYNLYLLSSGIIGLALGVFRIRVIDQYATSWKFIGMLMMIYSSIFIFDIDNYFSQIIITCVSLIIIYSIGIAMYSEQWWFKQVCIIGRYSLISYIAQILYLQATKNIEIPGFDTQSKGTFLLMVIIAFFTWATVIIVDYGRLKNRAIAWTYNFIFA